MAAESSRAPEALAALPESRWSRTRRADLVVSCAIASLLVTFALAPPARGATERAAGDDIRGVWVNHREVGKRKLAVWIEDCDGLLCGRIYWQKKPMSADGQPKRDRHNPDAALRDRPLCGLKIFSGFRRVKEGAWSAGEIYNPNDGRTYSSAFQLEPDGSLRINGYVGIPLFGKTLNWVRPKEPLDRCG